LAETYGTPLLVINLTVVDDAIDALTGRERPPGLELSYAAKAFANVAFFQHLARRDIGIDVCSLGEIVTAERAGIDANRLTLHGAGKTADELQAACDGRVGTIAVDGVEELERLGALARDGRCAAVLLRLNVGIEAHTHAFVRTGGAIEASARELFVHANTIRYRLRRIAETCGYDLANSRDRYVVQIAISLGRIGGEAS